MIVRANRTMLSGDTVMEYFDPHEKAKLMRHAGAQLLAVTLQQYDPPDGVNQSPIGQGC